MKNKGRDPDFKCTWCGKFLSYAEMADKKLVKYKFTPDTDCTIETHEYWHIACEEEEII